MGWNSTKMQFTGIRHVLARHGICNVRSSTHHNLALDTLACIYYCIWFTHLIYYLIKFLIFNYELIFFKTSIYWQPKQSFTILLLISFSIFYGMLCQNLTDLLQSTGHILTTWQPNNDNGSKITYCHVMNNHSAIYYIV